MKALILTAALLFTLPYYAGKSKAAPAPSAAELAQAADGALLAAGQGRISRGLLDPDSANFRDVFVSPNRDTVCGQVNAKNRKGGYVGYRRFVAAADKAGIEADKTYFVESNWDARCRIDAATQQARRHHDLRVVGRG